MPDSTSIDALADDFADPPPEYGPVPLWWWDGEELEPDRMTEQLEALAGSGVSGVCFISKLPNGPKGDTPRYFTEQWWEVMEHAVAECERLGMELWVHDETYHHSPPTWREFWQDHIRTEAGSDPDLRGEVLHRESADVADGEGVTLRGPETFEVLEAAAYPRTDGGRLDLEGAVDLAVKDGTIEWDGREGEWHVAAVGTRTADLRYTDRKAVERYIDLHFEEYVRRLGDAIGETLVGTFEDELVVLNGEVPCDDAVLERFREEKGYDPVGNLIALYEEADATTDLRTDYYDVVVSLLEDNWFEPLYEWHENHGLARAHDNWGRNDLAAGTEQYGDYYRTMRWYQAPGYDDGGPQAIGQRNFFDAKLAASIAACYDRDRVWGELFHSTTWGFRPKSQLAGIVENFCYGCTLYDKHGCYYTTRGGWWAHAPPDTHFRQPYWEDVEELNAAAGRLSQVMSRGTPVVDVAVAYPAATMHTDWHPEDGVGPRGRNREEATRELAGALYGAGTDLVLADDGSLAGAAGEGRLEISGMEIPALVLPPSDAVPAETLATARQLYESGGVVVAVGGPPGTAVGDKGDARLFEGAWDGEQEIRRNDAGGVLAVVPGDGDVAGVLSAYIERDLRRDAPDLYHAHRQVADGDAYLLFNAREDARTVEVGFRSGGVPERWDPLTGEREPIHEFDREDGYTTTTFEFEPHGFALVVLRGDGTNRTRARVHEGGLDVTDVTPSTVSGYTTSGGEMAATVTDGDGTATVTGEADAPVVRDVSEGWEFDLEPALDNERGDFRYPPSGETLGPEVRRFAYRMERSGEDGCELGWFEPGIDDGSWEQVQWSYGPGFWRKTVDSGGPGATPDEPGAEGWERYEFSELVGKPGTHPYLMGYMSTVSDDYLVAPGEEDAAGRTYFWTTISTDEAGPYLCHYGRGVESVAIGAREVVAAPTNRGSDDADDDHDPEEEYDWLNAPGGNDPAETASVRLPASETPVLLGVEPGTETYFAVEPAPATAFDRNLEHVPRVRWFHGDGQGPARFDPFPWDPDPVGWYRFDLPAGTSRADLPVQGSLEVWVDGARADAADARLAFDRPLASPTPVAVRVEHEQGAYGGAAWTGPATVETEPVAVDTGDWRDLGLESYSGRAIYRRTVAFPDTEGARVRLDLGDVAASATVRVDGKRVGSVFAPPFTVDLTGYVAEGDHTVEIGVANTLANHFATETPKEYRELLVSHFHRREADLLAEYGADEQFAGGLRGRVTLRIEPAVTLSTK